MKPIIAIISVMALLTTISLPSFAEEKAMTDKSMMDMCKDQAMKDKVSHDKMDAYVKECVKKHSEMGGMGNKMDGMGGDMGGDKMTQPAK